MKRCHAQHNLDWHRTTRSGVANSQAIATDWRSNHCVLGWQISNSTDHYRLFLNRHTVCWWLRTMKKTRTSRRPCSCFYKCRTICAVRYAQTTPHAQRSNRRIPCCTEKPCWKHTWSRQRLLPRVIHNYSKRRQRSSTHLLRQITVLLCNWALVLQITDMARLDCCLQIIWQILTFL